MRCSRPKCTMLEDTIDDFGLPWPRYSMVVYGRYHAQVSNHRREEVVFSQYEWKKEAIIYSHLVLAVKLVLKRVNTKKSGAPRWSLSISDHESILETLKHREDPI